MFKFKRFKKAFLKTTTTASGGQDVKPMHALIAAEKALLLSLQKLSVDYTKAAEALKTWGKHEKDDLGDILTASSTLLNHFSLALLEYAANGHTMQRQLETMSMRGDSLDSLKQRRNSTHRKAEDTANQLSKMDAGNKYFSMHTEALKRLRKDVRKMDADIKSEDATFGDFKRTTTKVWLNLKLGGLQDCCERGAIAGKFGKLAAFEISEEITQPGVLRSPYSPTKVDNLVAEADLHVNTVGHSAVRSSEKTNQEPSKVSSSYISPQTNDEESWTLGPPQPPPNPPSHYNSVNYHQTAQPFYGSNDHLSERPDSFQSSAGRPHAPPQGTSGYTMRLSTIGSTSSESIAGLSHFQGPQSDRLVQTRPPGTADSGGHAPPRSSSRRPPFSEGTSHLQDNRPLGFSHPEGYPSRDPRSVGGQTKERATRKEGRREGRREEINRETSNRKERYEFKVKQ